MTRPATVRKASQDRWQAALARAIDAGLETWRIGGTGEFLVASKSAPGLAHRTDGRDCTCVAGANGDPVCQHRALYWHAEGMLDLDPEPDPPAPVALPVPDERARRYDLIAFAAERYAATHPVGSAKRAEYRALAEEYRALAEEHREMAARATAPVSPPIAA